MKRISFHRPQIRVAIAGVLAVVALSAVVSECFGVPMFSFCRRTP